MYKLILLPMIFMILLSLLPSDSFAHRSGCHRWHSCPSDDGSYVCGDTGHDSQCSGNDNKSSDKEKVKSTKSVSDKPKTSQLPKSTITEGIELSGRVTYVVDGDTLDVNGVRVRLALVDTPERGQDGYQTAKDFVKKLCLEKDAQVDIDDGQRGGDRYGREIGVVYCNGVNVNSELIDGGYAKMYTDYCEVSEFANDDWATC